MWNYINDVNEYTHGLGSLTLKFKGYAPCHNADEAIENIGYDSESDLANPTGSVFVPMVQVLMCLGMKLKITCT